MRLMESGLQKSRWQKIFSFGDTAAGNRVFLAGILMAAVFFRTVYFFQLLDSPFFRHPILDAGYYYNWAWQLASGGFRSSGDFSGNPLYAYFLAFLLRFLRAGPALIRVFQHLLGVSTCLLLYYSGGKLFGRKVGVVAGLLYAVLPLAIFYEGWLLSASLEAFLMTALLALLLAAVGRSGSFWLAGGILAGLLVLARPSLVPLGVAVWIILGPARERLVQRVARLFLFGVGLLIPLFLFSLQSFGGRGEAGFISPHGGENFYIGNHPRATGLGQMPEFARGIPELQRRDFLAESSRLSGRQLSSAQSSRFWFGQGLNFIRDYPLRFFQSLIVKVYLFFCGVDFFDNYQFQFFRDLFIPLGFPLSWRLLSALALAGLVAARPAGRSGGLLQIFLCAYLLSIALFFVTSRFRAPIAPLFCLAAAGVAVAVGEDLFRRRLLPAGGKIILTGLLFFFLAGPDYRPPFSAIYTTAAEVYARDGQLERAAEFLELAGREHAGGSDLLSFSSYRHYLSRAQVELKRGKADEAEKIFARILTEVRDRPGELHFEIANIWAENLRYGKAEEHYRAAVEADPGNFRALNNLGLTLKAQGEKKEAEELFRMAIGANPAYAAARGNLGTLLLEREEWEAALREFTAALEIDPGGMARFRILKAYCLRRLNRPVEAEAELEKCPPGILRDLRAGESAR